MRFSFFVALTCLLALLLAACGVVDYSPSGQIPEVQGEAFLPVVDLNATADTLILHSQHTFSFNATNPVGLIKAVSVNYNGKQLAQVFPKQGAVFTLDAKLLPEGEGTLALSADIEGEAGRALLLSRPAYVEVAPPSKPSVTIDTQDGYVALRWQRTPSRLPTTLTLQVYAESDAPRAVMLTEGREASGVWVDSLYLAGRVGYVFEQRNANGVSPVEVSYDGGPITLEAVAAQPPPAPPTLTWTLPPGGHAAVFDVIAGNGEVMARVDGDVRSWQIPSGFGTELAYMVRATGQVPGCPSCTSSLQRASEYILMGVGIPALTATTYLPGPSGSFYAVRGENMARFTLDAPTTERARTSSARSFSVAPDGRVFSMSDQIREHDPFTLEVIQARSLNTLGGGDAQGVSLAAGPNGRLLILAYEYRGGYFSFVTPFDGSRSVMQLRSSDLLSNGFSVRISADGNRMWSPGVLYDITGGGQRRFTFTDSDPLSATITPDVRHLVVARAGVVEVRDPYDQNRVVRTFSTGSKTLRYPQFDAVTGHLGGVVGAAYHVYRFEDGQLLYTVPVQPSDSRDGSDALAHRAHAFMLLGGVLFATSYYDARLHRFE